MHMLGASSVNVTAQELGRDAIYSRFEEYYADTSQDKIRDLLDEFAQHLKANPSVRAFLISYGGKQSCRNEALLRARLATRYLSKMHEYLQDASLFSTEDTAKIGLWNCG
jgi:hypothetical protein